MAFWKIENAWREYFYLASDELKTVLLKPRGVFSPTSASENTWFVFFYGLAVILNFYIHAAYAAKDRKKRIFVHIVEVKDSEA